MINNYGEHFEVNSLGAVYFVHQHEDGNQEYTPILSELDVMNALCQSSCCNACSHPISVLEARAHLNWLRDQGAKLNTAASEKNTETDTAWFKRNHNTLAI